jgi:hypothetical protein
MGEAVTDCLAVLATGAAAVAALQSPGRLLPEAPRAGFGSLSPAGGVPDDGEHMGHGG